MESVKFKIMRLSQRVLRRSLFSSRPRTLLATSKRRTSSFDRGFLTLSHFEVQVLVGLRLAFGKVDVIKKSFLQGIYVKTTGNDYVSFKLMQ